MARLQAAARARREAREACEACEAQQAAAGPSDAGPSEVECTGEQSREERDAMLRAEAVEVDADGEVGHNPVLWDRECEATHCLRAEMWQD